MRDKHAPHDEFVQRLETTIGQEIRRRNASVPSGGWLPQWQMKSAVGIAALIVVSMAIGGVVVAAAYQAQTNEQRDALRSSYERRAALAEQRMVLAQQQLKEAEQRVAVGLGNQDAVLEARVKFGEAEAAIKVVSLQLEEIRMTAREPLNEVSSPLVSGRDFVTERWKVEATVPAVTLEVEKQRVRSAEQRVSLGVADSFELEVSRTRVMELEAGLEAFQRKLDIRQRFLKGEMDAAMADLRILEGDTEQRRKALAPKIDLAKKTSARMDERFRTGLATSVERAEAQLRLLELQAELAKLDADLALIQRQIAQRKGK